jgi:hypothetical protein
MGQSIPRFFRIGGFHLKIPSQEMGNFMLAKKNVVMATMCYKRTGPPFIRRMSEQFGKNTEPRNPARSQNPGDPAGVGRSFPTPQMMEDPKIENDIKGRLPERQAEEIPLNKTDPLQMLSSPCPLPCHRQGLMNEIEGDDLKLMVKKREEISSLSGPDFKDTGSGQKRRRGQ